MPGAAQNAENHISVVKTERASELEPSDSLESGLPSGQRNTGSNLDAAVDKVKRKQSAEESELPHRILEEYHKWKVKGRKGDPPAKLKISQ